MTDYKELCAALREEAECERCSGLFCKNGCVYYSSIKALESIDKLKAERDAAIKDMNDYINHLDTDSTSAEGGKYMNEILKLMKFFPNSFINCHFELILSLKGNVYFKCNEGMTREDILCKIFEWCSRECAKNGPYVRDRTNKIWRDNLISNFNAYLGTNFNQSDFYLIYDRLGNAVNHDLTVRFVKSGFNMDVLKEEST